jgi:hypothetical protein
MEDDCQQRFPHNVKTAEGNGPESQLGVEKDLGPIMSEENCSCDSSLFKGISKLVGTICHRGILSLVPELNNLTVPLVLFLQLLSFKANILNPDLIQVVRAITAKPEAGAIERRGAKLDSDLQPLIVFEIRSSDKLICVQPRISIVG